jgi:hypothetical protein
METIRPSEGVRDGTTDTEPLRRTDRSPDHDGDRLALLLPRTDRGVAAIGVPDPERRVSPSRVIRPMA